MRIAVLSDTHRMVSFIDKILPDLKQCDLIVHAGDNFIDSKYIHSMTNVSVMAVKGNCDLEDVEDELVFLVGKHKVFLCHGDKYDVKYDLEMLDKKASDVDCEIVIFGHTHVPFKKDINNKIFLNPGSLSMPREVSYRSYAIMNVDDQNIYIEFIKL